MSVFSNPAGTAVENAAQYTEAVLSLLGDSDPINVLESTAAWCEERTAALSNDQVTLPESAEKWNVVAVLQHRRRARSGESPGRSQRGSARLWHRDSQSEVSKLSRHIDL